MEKAKLSGILGNTLVLSSPERYRIWLESVLTGNDELKKARYTICLISYWLNANDDTYCPVETDDIKETVNILLSHIATEIDADTVNKYRYDYKVLGNLDAQRYVGGEVIANTIHLLDILCEEYDGHKCKKCYTKMMKSETYCRRCGVRFDFKYNF